MKNYAAALVAVVLLGGCSSSTELITADQIGKFTPGKTNETEVVAELGKPLHTITDADGTKIDQYASDSGASGGSILPSFLGGSHASSYGMVSFRYGAGGVLKDIIGSGGSPTK
jgi:hypothetical protein